MVVSDEELANKKDHNAELREKIEAKKMAVTQAALQQENERSAAAADAETARLEAELLYYEQAEARAKAEAQGSPETLTAVEIPPGAPSDQVGNQDVTEAGAPPEVATTEPQSVPTIVVDDLPDSTVPSTANQE